MGRKKKKQSKPWCWYCNREFDDEKILIQHQKAKHFKCNICHKKLYTGPGLSIHCMQVHKQTIDKVPNSLPNRNNIEIEIYGMEGIPDQDLKDHDRIRGGLDDDDDGPLSKVAKTDSPGMTPTPPGAMLGMPGMPGMPPGVRPGFGIAGANWNGSGIAGPSPATYSGQPTGPNGQPSRPLFPSAAGKPTFPAYGDSPERKPVLIVTSTATTRIVHPPEDISLEERRANMPRYAPPAPPVVPTCPPPPVAVATTAPAPTVPMTTVPMPIPVPVTPPMPPLGGAPLVSMSLGAPVIAAAPMMPMARPALFPPVQPHPHMMMAAAAAAAPAMMAMRPQFANQAAAAAAAAMMGQPAAAAAFAANPLLATPFGMLGTAPRFR